MTIEIVKFIPQHWHDIDEQEATAYLNSYLTDAHVERAADSPYAWTAFSGDHIVGCAGVVEYWSGRGEAWALLAKDCRKEFVHIHRAVKRFFDICPITRIEAIVDLSFPQASRWAEMLGFELEAPVMRKYSPDGKDYALYARVK